MPKATVSSVLLVANAVACSLFLLREPAPQEYLAEVDAARQSGGMLLSSGLHGMIACRLLYSWSEWHGGEALGVKVLEAANLPAVALTGIVATLGELGIAREFSACNWSWLLAAVFVVTASLQWWAIGALSAACMRRAQGRLRSRETA